MASEEADLLAHATDSMDFYALLTISPNATASEIRTGFRKTSLKYHPDKVGATPENIDKFLLVKLAHDVLSDPKVRALYDQTREAKERKKAESEKLEAGRRKMVSELERRERDVRGIGPIGLRNASRSDETPEQRLAREVGRISEENRRKKEEIMARREREKLEEEERLADEKEARERLKKSKEGGPRVHGKPDRNLAEDMDLDDFLKFERTVLARLRAQPRSRQGV